MKSLPTLGILAVLLLVSAGTVHARPRCAKITSGRGPNPLFYPYLPEAVTVSTNRAFCPSNSRFAYLPSSESFGPDSKSIRLREIPLRKFQRGDLSSRRVVEVTTRRSNLDCHGVHLEKPLDGESNKATLILTPRMKGAHPADGRKPKRATTPYEGFEDFSLSLSRSECFGTCPAYKVSVDGAGNVTFDGSSFVAAEKGIDLVSRETVQNLLDTLLAVDFLSVPEPQRQCGIVADDSSTIITLRYNGKENGIVVNYEMACQNPRIAALYGVADTIDALLNTSQWIEPYCKTAGELVVLNALDPIE